MIVGGYSLHLYCDVGGEIAGGKCPNKTWQGAAEFDRPTKAEAFRAARKAGWKLRDGRATCPKCAKEGRR